MESTRGQNHPNPTVGRGSGATTESPPLVPPHPKSLPVSWGRAEIAAGLESA